MLQVCGNANKNYEHMLKIKQISVVVFIMILRLSIISAQDNSDLIKINDKLQLLKISDNAYIHISYIHQTIPCNGLILVDKDKAFLFDTPTTDSITQILLDYIATNLKKKVAGFLTNDWHVDSQGGLGLINKLGIPSYSHEMTKQIAKSKGLPIAINGFVDSLKIKLNDKEIECYYLGAAHTMDNILVWIPSEKILFADCLIKELAAKDLGFTDDGDVNSYPQTLRKISLKFSMATYVIPGHGKYGGFDLIKHTIDLANGK